MTTLQLATTSVSFTTVKIVSDGFAGSPLNDDETGIIASFLRPNVNPGKLVLKEGKTFGVLHGLEMINAISRSLTMHCFFDELLRSFTLQASQGVPAFRFVAGYQKASDSRDEKEFLEVGPNASSCFREWMLNPRVGSNEMSEFREAWEHLGLPKPTFVWESKNVTSLEWTIKGFKAAV